MAPFVKFSEGSAPPGGQPAEFTFPDIWEKETRPEFSRLLIGCEEQEIRRVLELCRQLNGPFGVLYVLLVSRLGNESARYQSSQPIEFDELELFLYTFQEYFEQDGRHAIWVSSFSDESQFILDRHNLIYAYGDLDATISQLSAAGFNEGTVTIPVPHSHHYHAQFDKSEEEVLSYWTWLQSPLEIYDDP